MLHQLCQQLHSVLRNNFNKYPLWFFPHCSELLQSLFLGFILNEDDLEDQSESYTDYIKLLGILLKYDSKMWFDVLHTLKEDDAVFGEILLAKCIDLPLIQEILQKANIMLKKQQKISNYKWTVEVSNTFAELV